MMPDTDSRYYAIDTDTLTLPDGRSVVYLRRRMLPRGDSLMLLMETSVADGERLDQIAARTLGDPLHFWQICDANDAMDPLELEQQTGRRLRVPLPQR